MRTPHVISKPTSQDVRNAMLRDGHLLNEVEEWLALATLQSPRLKATDRIDPYLCRYTVPAYLDGDLTGPDHDVVDLVVLEWRGFLSAAFVTALLVSLNAAVRRQWAAMLVHGFDEGNLTVLSLPGDGEEREYLEWSRPPRR